YVRVADTYFSWLSFHTRRSSGLDDGGVQSLVAVGLGGGDIVLEPVGQRVVHIVDQAQGAVALGDGVQDDADGVDVVDLVKGFVLDEHLAVNAVDALDPALHGGAVDAAFFQPLFDQGRHPEIGRAHV